MVIRWPVTHIPSTPLGPGSDQGFSEHNVVWSGDVKFYNWQAWKK